MHNYETRRTCGVLCLMTAFLTAQASVAQSSSHSADEQEITIAAKARAAACADGDAQKWASYVDKNFRDIEGNRTAEWKDIFNECQLGARNVAGHSFERSVDEF